MRTVHDVGAELARLPLLRKSQIKGDAIEDISDNIMGMSVRCCACRSQAVLAASIVGAPVMFWPWLNGLRLRCQRATNLGTRPCVLVTL